MNARITRLLLAIALLGAFGVGQVSAIGMTTAEQTLRDRLVACAVIDQAIERHIALRRLMVTQIQCSLVR